MTREKETPKPKSDQSGNAGKTITKVEEPLFSEKTKELLRAMAKLLRTMVIAAVVAIVVLALLAIFLGVNVLTGGGLAIAIFLVLGTAIAAGLVHSLWK
jgi:ABC-type multidrug transport system permease subunit